MTARATTRNKKSGSLLKSAKDQAGFMLGMAKGILPMGGVLSLPGKKKNPVVWPPWFPSRQAASEAWDQSRPPRGAVPVFVPSRGGYRIVEGPMAPAMAKRLIEGASSGAPRGENVQNPEKWIKDAIKRPGAFRAKAKRAGETVHQLAVEKRRAPGVLGKEARLALILEGLRKRKRNPPVMSVTHGTRRADVHKLDKEFVVLIPGEKAQGPFSTAKAAAMAGRLMLAESTKNPFRKVGKTVQKLLAKITGRNGKNPQAAVEDMYTMFHGLPSTEIVEFREQVHKHEWLWAAGTLVSVHVKGRNGVTVKLTSPDPDEVAFENVVMLALSEDGRQVYFRGGDQGLPMDELMENLGMTDDDIRDNMLIGHITKITYRTFKSFEAGGKQPVDFWHPTGKEHSEGVLPVLCYHPLDPSMFVVGGRIKVAPKSLGLGASPGIIG